MSIQDEIDRIKGLRDRIFQKVNPLVHIEYVKVMPPEGVRVQQHNPWNNSYTTLAHGDGVYTSNPLAQDAGTTFFTAGVSDYVRIVNVESSDPEMTYFNDGDIISCGDGEFTLHIGDGVDVTIQFEFVKQQSMENTMDSIANELDGVGYYEGANVSSPIHGIYVNCNADGPRLILYANWDEYCGYNDDEIPIIDGYGNYPMSMYYAINQDITDDAIPDHVAYKYKGDNCRVILRVPVGGYVSVAVPYESGWAEFKTATGCECEEAGSVHWSDEGGQYAIYKITNIDEIAEVAFDYGE